MGNYTAGIGVPGNTFSAAPMVDVVHGKSATLLNFKYLFLEKYSSEDLGL